MSKTAKILKARKSIVSSFCGFAACAQDWEPKSEGDFQDLVDEVDEALELLAQDLEKYSHK